MADEFGITLPAMRMVCRLVLLNSIINPVPNVTQSPPQHQANHNPLPDGYFAFLDVAAAYKYNNQTATWIEARNICQKEGAKLLVIDSAKKIEILKGWGLPQNYMHAGMIRMDGTKWSNVNTGSDLPSPIWHPNFPSSGSSNCAVFHPVLSGLTNEFTCGSQLAYLCELPIFPNFTTITAN